MQVTTGSVVNVLIEFNESVLIKTNACLPVHNTRVVQQLNSAVIYHMLTLEDNSRKLLKEKQNKNRHLTRCLFNGNTCIRFWCVLGGEREGARRLPSASSVNRRRAQEKNCMFRTGCEHEFSWWYLLPIRPSGVVFCFCFFFFSVSFGLCCLLHKPYTPPSNPLCEIPSPIMVRATEDQRDRGQFRPSGYDCL